MAVLAMEAYPSLSSPRVAMVSCSHADKDFMVVHGEGADSGQQAV